MATDGRTPLATGEATGRPPETSPTGIGLTGGFPLQPADAIHSLSGEGGL